MTKDQKGRLAAYRAIAPLSSPANDQPNDPDRPEQPKEDEDHEELPAVSRASHQS